MGRISRLAESVVNKIAAGEVIERPASVVKELVENAIDAGATDVRIEIRGGGTSLIRVRDNGCGMSRDDAILSLERHSTSKIRKVEDLFDVTSRGFRGEALPSITAVSRMELVTKERGALSGTRITTVGGTITDVRDAGAPDGTEVVVRDLFFNTPVRRKFLRSRRTEVSHITGAVTIQALTAARTAFTLLVEGEELIKAPPAAGMRERISTLYGSDLERGLVSLEAGTAPRRLLGFAGKPDTARGNRSGQHFFVNGRPVRDRLLAFAVSEAYGGFLPARRYPVVFLFLDLDPREVDVNVHPAKREVRFREARRLRQFVREAVEEALREADLAPAMGIDGASAAAAEGPLTYITKEQRGAFERIPTVVPDRGGSVSEAAEIGLTESREGEFRLLGQVRNLYLVAEAADGVAIIDQHAAHERILFEKMMRLYRQGLSEEQPLLLPAVVTLSAAEFAVVREYMPALRALGIRLEEFGSRDIKVCGMPAVLGDTNAGRLIRNVVAELAGERGGAAMDDELAELTAKKVCRAAVKRRDSLSGEEMQRLLDDLLACENPYTCPHGRPTIVRITGAELDRKFGRQ